MESSRTSGGAAATCHLGRPTMRDQLALFDLAYRPAGGAPVEAKPLYDGQPKPCQGDGCGVVGAIYGRAIARDLCLRCTVATVRRLRAEGRTIAPGYEWVPS